MPVRFTRSALVASRSVAAEPSSTATFILFSVSLWKDLADHGIGLKSFMSRANAFVPSYLLHFSLLLFSLSLLSFYGLVLWGWGQTESKSISPSHALPIFFNNNINITWYLSSRNVRSVNRVRHSGI